MRILLTLFSLFICISITFSQNGKLLSKKQVELAETPIWQKISQDNKLHSNFEYLDQLNYFFITYQSDEHVVRGILIEPKAGGKFPVVIFNRGGNRDFAPLTLGTLLIYTSKLAEQGYVIIGSNYREQDEFGGAEISDVLILTDVIKNFKKADFNNIGMFGWSRGGMMTYLALKNSDKIKTAIVGNGATNLFDTIQFRPEMETHVLAECIPNYWQNKTEALESRSAVYWANQLNKESSLLILSGTKDQRVNPEQAEDLAKKLKQIHYNFELMTFETDHFFSDKKAELNEVVINWFDKHLKKQK